MRKRFSLAIVSCSFLVSACGVINSMQREIEEDPRPKRLTEKDFDYYRHPASKIDAPPPASVGDARLNPVAGSPVDLAGTRAKKLRTTAKDFWQEAQKNENSLWLEEGQNNYLFARNKLKMPGDLISVVIEDKLRNDMIGSVKRLLPPEYHDAELNIPGLTKNAPAATDDKTRAPATTAPASSEPGPDDLLTAEVMERYMNGNLRIRGVKRVPFKSTVRSIEVIAILKGSAIDEKDSVKSSEFFEQRVEIYK